MHRQIDRQIQTLLDRTRQTDSQRQAQQEVNRQRRLQCLTATGAYLQQTVSNKSHQQPVTIFLHNTRGVLSHKHRCEVEHGHIRLPVMIDSILKEGELLIGGEICCFKSVGHERLLVYVVTIQQCNCICMILR